MIQPDLLGLYHPASEEEIIDLVKFAGEKNLQVRVRGAAQSVGGAVFTDGFNPTATPPVTGSNINILLNNLRKATFNDQLMQVTVDAGCNLGYDPNDPSQSAGQKNFSTVENGLFFQMALKNYAIQNMSDAVHQTISGFISTGSSGGSIRHALLEAIVSIRIIDGTGTAREFNKPNPENLSDPFYAVGVSLGLLGIITQVTLQCVPAYNIIGTQYITPDNAATLDFFGPGSATLPNLQTYLTNTEFTRLMWWPYPTVKRLVTWQARTMQAGDYNSQTGPPDKFIPKPYKDVFPKIFGSEIPSEAMADCFFSLIGNWPNVLTDVLGNDVQIGNTTIPTKYIQDGIDLIWPFMLPVLLNVFFPVDGSNPPQQFWDTWNDGLPMDSKEYSNNLFPAYHSEFWVPVSKSQQVMLMLQDYYTNDYFKNANSQNANYANGCYVVEVFGAKRSNFWLSPSYKQDSMRVNLFSFQHTNEYLTAYYQQFWDLFSKNKIDFRLHWGYYLPPQSAGEGGSYLTSQYPMWNEFQKLRAAMDPKNIFLTTYWKQQLNITESNG